ncbi:MAG TPA: DUF488 domain-containing protein [Thermodesulfobacteriota bacterium]|nr:DUF488 domain-containing protein [Thermodesulfobacteriota bacterium]HOC38026.1 DUF488 domain-containing protein [Thermodesulfobacteriota bacterium]
MIKMKRIYDDVSPDDGRRIYIDRLWPRGVKKDTVKLDEWVKEIAPSDALRQWFAHDPSKFEEFKKRYMKELESKKDIVERLRKEGKGHTITLLFSAKDTEHNNATVLQEVLSR